MRKRTGNRWVVLAVFGGLFIALFVIVGVADGIGHPSVPSGDVAVVEDAPDGTITQEDFDAALAQAAARQGLPKAPEPSDPQYATLRDSAMSAVLQARWFRGEAEERGITVSDTEITQRLQQFQKQVGNRAQFEKYIKKLGFTPEEARDQVELSLLGTQIQEDALPQEATVSDAQVSDFYEANKSQFSQPETRDVRQIINEDQAQVEQAKSLLEQDDSPKSWNEVAAKYSTDKATKDSGGLRQGVAEGQGDPALDQQIFDAAEGALVGPFQAQGGYYLIQVEKVTPAETTPLDKVSEQIKQQLSQGVQQQAVSDLQADFLAKWVQRSFCASDYVMDQCANFTPGPQQPKGAAPVTPTGAVSPGSTAVVPGQPIPALPQRPCAFEDSSLEPPEVCEWPTVPPAGQAPGVLGPTGAPQLPPGAAPQTAPPGG